MLGVLLTFAPAVIGLRTLSHRDTDKLFAPIRTLVVEALRDGRLPLWSPYEGTGKPLFAEGIHSVLHPISLLGAAVAPASIDFLILAYLVGAALGAFALARTLGASPPASAGAGLAFALSGFSVSMTGNLVFLAGLSTLPWLVAAARSAGAGGNWGPALTALATGCAFLSGDAQIALVGLALGLLLAADAGGWRGAARALAGMIPGLLLAAVQVAATRELLPRTYRSLDLTSWEKEQWALPPGRLIEWVVPGLVRGPLAQPPGGAGLAMHAPVFAESVYLGAPLLVAAGLGATWGRRRAERLLAIAAVTLLWLSLGHHLGARQLLDWVPVWNRFRYTEKLMAPLTLCVSALGALGIDAFRASRLSRTWTRALVALTLAAGVALLALAAVPVVTQELAAAMLGEGGPYYRSTFAAGLPHLLLGLGALLAVDRLRRESARGAALALLVALASATAVRHGAHFGSPAVRRFVTPLRLGDVAPVPRLATPVDGLYRATGLDHIDATAEMRSILLNPAINVAHRVDTIDAYTGFPPRRLTTLSLSLGEKWATASRRYGVTHVAVPIGVRDAEPYEKVTARSTEGGELVQRDEETGFALWRVPHRPWAFFPLRSVAKELPPDAHRELLDLIARGDDDTVVVEATATPPTAPGRVLRIERSTETLRIEAESDGPALLVVQDAHWPGWHATLDGLPAEILIADLLVRAVRWPPGRHTLVMVYDPPGVRLGIALSALGAVLVAVLAVIAARRSRRGNLQGLDLPP